MTDQRTEPSDGQQPPPRRGRGRPRKTGLRDVQLRALAVLSLPQYAGGLPLDDLARIAGVSVAVMRRGIGPIDRRRYDAHNTRNGYKCLLSLGHVRVEKWEYKRGVDTGYAITSSGKHAAEKRFAEAIAAVKLKPVRNRNRPITTPKPTPALLPPR